MAEGTGSAITAGAVFNGGMIYIGNGSGGTGTVSVEHFGIGSSLNSGALNVGNGGTGSLTITNGGLVSASLVNLLNGAIRVDGLTQLRSPSQLVGRLAAPETSSEIEPEFRFGYSW